MGDGGGRPAQAHEHLRLSQRFLYMASFAVKIYGSTHRCGTPRVSWSLSLPGNKKKKPLNAAHENEISTQEDEGCLFDDRNLGNMACILQGTSLTFFFLKKKNICN